MTENIVITRAQWYSLWKDITAEGPKSLAWWARIYNDMAEKQAQEIGRPELRYDVNDNSIAEEAAAMARISRGIQEAAGDEQVISSTRTDRYILAVVAVVSIIISAIWARNVLW